MILFYSTLNLEVVSTQKAMPGVIPKNFILLVPKSSIVTTQANQGEHQTKQTTESNQESTIINQPDVLNVSVSEDLAKLIPQNGAYWNRLLHSALRLADKGKYTSGSSASWFNCKVTNQEFLKTNVYDFTSYPDLFQDFVQSMNCRTPPIMIDQPNKCLSSPEKGHDQIFLLFAIKSKPNAFEKRQAIRETWGQEQVYENGLGVRTVFILGTSPADHPDLSQLLLFESQQFSDILQWDFHESFLNLTIKANMFLQWTVKSCPYVSFIFSGDDDVFVNTPAIINYLKSLEPSKASRFYGGHVITSAMPLRDLKSKYYIPPTFYDGPYPSYAGGGGFVFSGVLLQPLCHVFQILPFFPIDDVYISMCMKAIGISSEALEGFHTFDIKEQERENLCYHKSLFLIHRRKPVQLKKLWKGIHSPWLTC